MDRQTSEPCPSAEGLRAAQGFLAGDGGQVWEKLVTCLFWVIQRQKRGSSKARLALNHRAAAPLPAWP